MASEDTSGDCPLTGAGRNAEPPVRNRTPERIWPTVVSIVYVIFFKLIEYEVVRVVGMIIILLLILSQCFTHHSDDARCTSNRYIDCP